ncbi:hypothetical protein BBJ28_00005246 [Nothophytophthora sp. Chile5]|nr:hypothetical protein BBJ28_00005246 [Nothophytophthora sp. Chile5]
MGAANSVCKLTIDSMALLEQLEPNAAELASKRAVCGRVQELLALEWPACRVLPFGSSESGLGFGGCDLDLGIYFQDVDVDAQGHFSPQERIELLTTACERLGGAFEVKQFIRNARVPVIKLWDPKRQVERERARQLIACGSRSHQSEAPLPSAHAIFQSLQAQTKISELLERLRSVPAMELPSTFGTSELNSVGALLAGFFQFYAHRFNMEDEVVSVRTGSALSKTTKWSHPVSWRLSIEDPFELAHDVGRVIFHRNGQELLRSEFQRACDLVEGGHRLEDICSPDHTSWNAMATCYICRGRDHVTRDCGQLAHQRLQSGGASSLSFLSDCWYCGEYGHFKAACPMLFFRDIPRPMEPVKPDGLSVAEGRSGVVHPLTEFKPAASASAPIPIAATSTLKATSPPVSRSRVWDRGLSPSSSLIRPSKKKKRRHGSPPAACASISWGLLPSGSSPDRRQSYQQQQRRRQFPIVAPARKCGGAGANGSGKSGRSHVGKILCPS